MDNSRRWGLVVIWIFNLALGLSAFGTAQEMALHVDGAQLKNAEGQAVRLRGINHSGFVDAPDGAWDLPGKPLFSGLGHWSPEAIKAALDSYQQLGFNVIRLHTIVEWWKTNATHYEDAWRVVDYPQPYRQMLKDVIQWSAERGLYVIFDFYAMRNLQGKQSGQETLPWPPAHRHPQIVGSRAEFVALWTTVARELRSFPNVLFELYNEPNGNENAESEWFGFCQEALTAIRVQTPTPVLIQWDYGCWVNLDFPPPQNAASTLAWIERHALHGSNIVYGTHLYRNSGEGGAGAVHRKKAGLSNLWERSDIEEGLKLALFLHVTQELKKPLLVTEIGAYLKYPGTNRDVEIAHELDWFKHTLAILNQWKIGYLNWAWQADEQLDHGSLHEGQPNAAGKVFLDSLRSKASASP